MLTSQVLFSFRPFYNPTRPLNGHEGNTCTRASERVRLGAESRANPASVPTSLNRQLKLHRVVFSI